MISFIKIAEALQGKILQNTLKEAEIRHLFIDSRKISFANQGLFFALKGDRHDGHAHLKEVYQKGVRNFVVSQITPEIQAHLPEANLLKVPDTKEALQHMAAMHRACFKYPVVGITGSNGKTIIKEWLAHLMAGKYKVIKSPKSFNSQVGVPLSLWEMQDWHELAIFEAGISQKGEMKKLQAMIRPEYGIFTNLGTAHDEGFSSKEEKLQEKLQLFEEAKFVIYKRGISALDESLAQKKTSPTQWLAWQPIASEPVFDTENKIIYVKYTRQSPQTTQIDLFFSASLQKNFLLPFALHEHASLENISHALITALKLGLEDNALQQGLHTLPNVEMRLTLKAGQNQCVLVDDSYNNDLAGLQIALDFLISQSQHSTQIAILSEIKESGLPEKILYQRMARLLSEKKLSQLVGIGENFAKYQDLFQMPAHFFENTEGFLESLLWKNFKEATILVKGARKFAFEKIVQRLEKQNHGTVLEINLEALVHNLNFYRSLLKPNTQLMVMVKAFAYGSGLGQVANLLQFHKVDYLAVAYADEGVALRQQGVHLPIMVMNPGEETWEKIFSYDLEPEIYSFKVMQQYLSAYQELVKSPSAKTQKIHLKLDTGMHRLGFEESELEQLLDLLEKSIPYHVQVASVFSHLAGADDAQHEDFSKNQIATFRRMAQKIEDTLGYTFLKHILNSPGIVRFPEAQLDMVRLGIGLYGIEANAQQQAMLMPIGTLKTTISQIKSIPKGESIGYGRRGKALQDTRTATIAIGYADGFSRKLSQGVGKVWIKGKPAAVIGNVCMDMTMIDLGNIPAQEGDEVIVFSPEHSLLELAEKLDTIPYEILTSISERVKRVFYS